MSGIRREEPEGVHVAGPDRAKVTLVQGRELHLTEPLDDRQHGCVHEPEIRVLVQIAER